MRAKIVNFLKDAKKESRILPFFTKFGLFMNPIGISRDKFIP